MISSKAFSLPIFRKVSKKQLPLLYPVPVFAIRFKKQTCSQDKGDILCLYLPKLFRQQLKVVRFTQVTGFKNIFRRNTLRYVERNRSIHWVALCSRTYAEGERNFVRYFRVYYVEYKQRRHSAHSFPQTTNRAQ